ncbi:hypothetical protein JTB14_012520 [Gonioctena quinquepunctata]|nr:hypothetical protein JTB14_012520 [Gonioctena quinquepunctata]
MDTHGYTYDFNIYTGKETEPTIGTLGERVVKTLASTIKENDMLLCFDRFFTSVNLFQTLDNATLGTCISNRVNSPQMLYRWFDVHEVKRNEGSVAFE